MIDQKAVCADMKNGDLDVTVSGADDRNAWEQFVEASSRSTMCHQFAWKDIIERSYGHRTFYLMAKREGVVVGVLPLVLVQPPLIGGALVSLPFMDYGGVCAEDSSAGLALVDKAMDLLKTTGARTLELRQCDAAIRLDSSRQDKVSMILDLTPGSDAIWKSLPAKVRNQVRKAEKSGLMVCVGGVELIDDFYDVFVVNMRDLGSPVHSKRFFLEMGQSLGSLMRVTLVRDGQRTVGGLISLFFKRTMLVPWASSLREYFSKCPNNLLYWDAILDGCKRGCVEFDFGRSTVGSGTYDFKKQWGAQPRQLFWQHLRVGGAVGTTLSRDDAKSRFAVEVWRRLPVGATGVLGPMIRRYLTN